MREAFEIVYADGAVITGSTVTRFRQAPDEGIQFVIVRYADGSTVKHKAQDEYEYHGATKPGSWTESDNYESLKARLPQLSKLMFNPDPDNRRNRRR